MWIDFHTHQTKRSGTWTLMNFAHGDLTPSWEHSVGIHPWWLQSESTDALKSWVLEGLNHPLALAIGECGIDKRHPGDLDQQTQIARWHIELAGERNLPLVFHCVKAHQEIMSLLQTIRPNVPVMFHGFRGSLHLADHLIKHGYFLGIGKSCFDPLFEPIIKHIPLENLTIESDDALHEVESIYAQIAQIKQIPIEVLQLVMKQHALSIFGAKFRIDDGS
jgi:TatD DNase family protein